MKFRSLLQQLVLLATCVMVAAGPATGNEASHSDKHSSARRNVIIFIADGLRTGSVNSTDAPTMLALREHGVFFRNSHAMPSTEQYFL